MKETELYQPVKDLFESMGYEVFGEVNDIDVVAVKEDKKIVVELKTTFSMKLILQGVKRQKIYEDVYVAIPFPKFKSKFSKDFKDKEYLLRRLELGLIFVSSGELNTYAQIVLDPKPYNMNNSRSRNGKKRNMIERELSNRHGDNNVGGTKGKLVTVYREKALLLASYLRETGEMTTKKLRELSGNEKTTNILNKNYYGWFERAEKGIYKLSDKGRSELEHYNHVINKIRTKDE